MEFYFSEIIKLKMVFRGSQITNERSVRCSIIVYRALIKDSL